MTIIRSVAAWISTAAAVSFLRARFGDGHELVIRRIDPLGAELSVMDGSGFTQTIGVQGPDLVRIARYMLAVAAAQGNDVNEGHQFGGYPL